MHADYLTEAGVDAVAYAPFSQAGPVEYNRVISINTTGVFYVILAVERVIKP